MKKRALLIWNIPLIAREAKVPLLYFIHIKMAKEFKKALDQFFEENNIPWEVDLDSTNADFKQISKNTTDLLILAPGAKTRCWMYEKEILNTEIPLYYLNGSEYYNKKLNALKKFILSL